MHEAFETGGGGGAPAAAPRSGYGGGYCLIWKPELLLRSAVGCVVMKIPIHISHGCHKQKS